MRVYVHDGWEGVHTCVHTRAASRCTWPLSLAGCGRGCGMGGGLGVACWVDRLGCECERETER